MPAKFGEAFYWIGIAIAGLAVLSWGVGPLVIAFIGGPDVGGPFIVWGSISLPAAVLSYAIGLLCRNASSRAETRESAREDSVVYRSEGSEDSNAVVSRMGRRHEKRAFRH